jgi:REP element-mobilizing transposase RayT
MTLPPDLGPRAAGALASSASQHTGWRSRGYLPHFDAADTWQSITYRLADAMPRQAIEAMERDLRAVADSDRHKERRRHLEAWADAGHGACLLRRPHVAQILWDNWHRFAGERYDMGPWVIMPNHVHLLIRTHGGWPLENILRSWKSFTAKRIMEVASVPAPVWHHDYWDRYIRDEGHWLSTKAYIENNPVAAGLVSHAADWPWSSASWGQGQGRVRDRAPLARFEDAEFHEERASGARSQESSYPCAG